MEAAHTSLVAGGRALGRDPVGVLVPAGGVLLLRLAEVLAIRALLGLDLLHLALAVVLLHLTRGLLATPLRAAVLAAGARAMGREARALTRVPSLLVVMAVLGVVEIVVVALLAAIPVALGAWLLVRASVVPAALAFAVGALLGEGASIAVRAAFAYAPVEAVVGGSGPLASLRAGVSTSTGDWWGLAAVILVGDLALGVGALAAGVLSLPAWPWPHLAVVHRWLAGAQERKVQ